MSQASSATSNDDWPAKRRITLIGGVVNLLLSGGKVAAGVIGHSQALVADGIHSLSDLLSDGLVLLAARWGSRAADSDHPYGHARIETAATILVGVILLMVAGGFVHDSVSRLLDPTSLLSPGWLALGAALASIGVKEVLYRYTQQVAHETASPLIAANAWHHRSDALSSVVVVVGVTGAMLGMPWLDAVAAIVVALFLGRIGWRFMRQGVEELVDTGLPPSALTELEQLIDTVPGVHGHHRLRTRRMAGNIIMDVHILLDPEIRLSEANRIATQVQRVLIRRVDAVTDVTVRIEPDDSLAHAPADAFPPRETIIRDLQTTWSAIPELKPRPAIDLHYHADGVDVDVRIHASQAEHAGPPLQQALRESSNHLLYVNRIRLLLTLAPDGHEQDDRSET